MADSLSAGGGPSLQDAVLKFHDVSERFRVQNLLLYLSSVESLECALRFIDTPEALTFLGDYLYKMIHTLLRQNPSNVNIGIAEHKMIKQSLALAMDILLKVPVSILYDRHLNSLAMLLDKSNPYYSGGTNGWGVATLGHIKTRDEQLKKFASRDGFQLLLDAPKNAETEQSILWVAGKPEIFRSLLSALADYGHKGLDGAFKSTFAEMAMALIMSLNDDQLKSAIAATTPNQPPPLQSTLWALRHLCASLPDHPGSLDMFYKFWMDHTNKLLHLPPLVIKLFAWEQMQELLLEALKSEPHVAGYVVSGAGLDYVNGTYMNYNRNKDQTSLLYIKTEPDDDQKEGSISASALPPPQLKQPLLLFRCKMNSGQHFWFFSFADKLEPGTEMDVDVYQHKCRSPQYAGLEYTRAPPLEGWEACPGGKVSQTLSMPQLTPLGKIFEAGVTEEMTLPSRLVKWSLDRKLIEQAFGSSIHRAIVGNSKGLLDFLAHRDAISLEDLAVIWKSGLSEDADTADEVLTLLAHVALKLDSEKFGQLMDLIYSDVEGPGAPRVAVFLEKFNPLPQHQGLPSNSEKFLNLLWAVYQSKSFPTLALKNPSAAENLKQLLSSCICHDAGKSFAIQRIVECVDAIDEECREDDEGGEEGGARSTQEDEGGKEAKPRLLRKPPGKQKNILQLLDFLTSLPVMHSIIDNIQELNLPAKLVAEVGIFVHTNRQAGVNGQNNSEKYREEISLRLKVIRQYFAFGNGEIPQAMLDALWTLFQAQPLELDTFFHFLTVPVRVVSMHLHNRDGMASSREHIFVSYICSPVVDWSKVTSSSGFACFYTHFLELNLLPSRTGSQELQHKNGQLQELGLRTLWNIFRTIADAEFPPEIVQLLLKTHDCESKSSVSPSARHPSPPPDSCSPARELLPIVLEILASAASSSSSSSSSTAVVRCADLLRSAITVSGPMTAASHAVRGVRGRINVIVSYHTSLVQFPASSRVVNYTRGVEGTTSIEVHPMETVRSFKEKIAAALEWEDVTQIHFKDASLRDCNDSCPLQLLSIAVSECSDDVVFISEGTVVDCTYLQPSTYGGGVSKSLANAAPTIGDLLAINKAHFNTLLSICDASPQTSKKIWDLIMLAPTQVDCEREVRAAMEGVSGEKCWEPLLGGPDAAVVAYNLQIIDSILQPAPEHHEPVLELSKSFILSGGLSHLLQVLITSTSASSSSESVSRQYAIEAALHVVRLLLAREREGAMAEISRINVGLLVEKLLAIASNAAVSGSGAGSGAGNKSQDGVVEDALSTINDLVHDQAAASQLIQHPQSRPLLITVLKSQSKKVRSLSAEFAVQVGRRQPSVFSWLLADLGSCAITSSENNSKNLSGETFFALNTLLQHFCCEAEDHLDFQGLAALLSEKMLSPRDSRDPDQVLHGYLDMLNTLVACRPACIFSTRLGKNFVGNFFENFLFSMDETSEPVSPLLRRAVYNVLGSFLSVSPASSGAFEEVVMGISKLSDKVSGVLKGNWLSSVQGEVKKPDIAFSGLKNQGCTCYMNSCLQQLFMCKPFREAVLATPLSETQRTSIFHRSDEELVGMDLQMLIKPNSAITTARASAAVIPEELWCAIKIVSYDPQTKKHKFVANGSTAPMELNFRIKGMLLRLARPDGREPVNPSQEAAIRIVEQLQRTFCHMAYSKKRFFDPLPLVEACKTMNLNFNVFQQNDATEFYDKLLDRIEMSTKAPGENVWASLFEKNVFGGHTLYQKIPLECERFAGNKDECGHWQGTRTESFLRVELQISNHDNINDSLAEFFKTELMDGDNKIKCDVCNEAKATNRRSCLGALPNTMVLHLKRFDMDYSTFETVKLNNKMEFPLRINMLKYTREGVEMQEDGTAGGGQSGRTGSKEEGIHYARDDENAGNAPNPADYEYELQGVLIHAGVAGGGHYYSYARDPDNTERWYRLDDDEVTSFNFSPESIAYNCFGGTHHRENGVEETRTANALMLFYSKIVAGGKETGGAAVGGGQEASESGKADVEEEAAEVEVGTMPLSADQAASTPRMITGREAYYHEVQESNMEHTLLRYMLDPDLHAFVRNAIEALAKGNSLTLVEELASLKVEPVAGVPAVAEESVQFGVKFFLSVVLHCRDKSEKDWIACLSSAFVAKPQTALWFIQQLSSPSPSQNWLSEYIEKCHEPRAKTAFIQLVVAAAAALSPADPDYLLPYIHPDASSPPPASPAGALAAFLVAIQERIFAIPASFSRSSGADDLFVLIRELANSSACLRRALLEMHTISVLSYFLLNGYDTGKNVIPISPSILSRFSEPAAVAMPKNKSRGFDFDSLVNSVLEAIAAILNVPQMRKAPLLVEALVPKSDWGTEELSPEARDAFQLIFEVYAINGIMSEKEFAAYLSKSYQKEMAPSQCRISYERYASPAANGGNPLIRLSGFLSYQVDRISLLGDKQAWVDLHQHGFRNDLKCSSDTEPSASGDISDQLAAPVPPPIPDSCIKCLRSADLYRNAMTYQRQTITKGILRKICANNSELSTSLIAQVD